MTRPFVRVLGLSLVAAGCSPKAATPPTYNPPPPDPAETPAPTDEPPVIQPTNPPVPVYPTWDEVASGHPPGATNPPYPVLYVAKDSGVCFKGWMGGMMPAPADIRAAGGRVVSTTADLAEGQVTRVQCPEGQPETLLAKYALVPAKDLPGGGR